MKVLVVEDDPVPRRLLQGFLDTWGYEVSLAHDGAQAWDLFQRDEYRIVISDWIMPGIDGLELVRRIRSGTNSGYVYIILLTGKSAREDLVQAMETGADDFMSKPFDRGELRVRLRAGERIIQLEQKLARRNQELQVLNAGLTAANERMKHDLDAAARVQRALLPTALPEVSGVRFAWYYKPCEELAGDILNVFRLDEGHLGLYVLDVSGHGVASALMSVTVSRFLSPVPDSSSLLLRRIADTADHVLVSPAEIAAQLNRRFLWDEMTEQFFTLIYGVLDLKNLGFRYVSAGHPGLAYVPHDAPTTILEAPSLPIGIAPTVYEEHWVGIKPGDRLYLYSDGVIEVLNADDELFGQSGLISHLDVCRALTLEESVSGLVQAAEGWRGNGRLMDDVSILAVEIIHQDSKEPSTPMSGNP